MARTRKEETAAAAEAEVKTAPAAESEDKAESSAAENPAASEERRIYVGASLPGAKANTVFAGEIPKILKQPFICELVVPLDKLTETKKNIAVTSSREAFCYRKSVAIAAELRK